MTCCRNCDDGDDGGDGDDGFAVPWHWRDPAAPRVAPCVRNAGVAAPAGGAVWRSSVGRSSSWCLRLYDCGCRTVPRFAANKHLTVIIRSKNLQCPRNDCLFESILSSFLYDLMVNIGSKGGNMAYSSGSQLVGRDPQNGLQGLL